MQYAIDRFITGLEKEVSAADFDDQYYIPRRSERFFCPECGLQVSWVTSTDNRSSFFRHPNRTETSPECDKRVDGRSELYLYERVGLPLFLSRLPGNNFQLEISFPPLGSKWLENAAAKNAKVIIQGNGINRTISVNSINFYSDQMTLVPVNFLPKDNDRFRIDVTPSTAYSRKWSDYAEGFTSEGAIFNYDETGGKKIHRDDSIVPGRQYYVVSRYFWCPYNEVASEIVGTLKMQNTTYQVYCMTVNVSLQNVQLFSAINNFLRYKFGVGLLETAPEIIPLWPPVIQQDVLVPTKDSPIFCAISSGNNDPSVYSYIGSQVMNIPVHKSWNGEKHIFVKPSTVDTVLSVDRKYIGREIVFKVKELSPGNSKYDFSIRTQQGNVLLSGAISDGDLSAGGILTSTSKFDLYLGSLDHSFLRIPIRANETLLPAFSNLRLLFAAVDGGRIYAQIVSSALGVNQVNSVEIDGLFRQFRGEYIPVPRWVFVLLNDLRRKGMSSAAQKIVEHITNGKLPAGAISALYQLYRMNGVTK